MTTGRVVVPLRYCPAHDSHAGPTGYRCEQAAFLNLAKPCPLTPPLSYETTEGDTPNE